MADFHSEWTPMQFWGERQEPNPVEWLRLEQFGKGASSRLFYNEVPHPWWHRHGGHLDNAEEVLYSFTHADQATQINFGLDTTTPEGRAAWTREYEALSELAPEIVKKENFIYPHQLPKYVSQEPHFQRVWTTYRQQTLRNAIENGVSAGSVAAGDAAAAIKFLGAKNQLSVSQYVQGLAGARPDLAQSEGFQAAQRVFAAIGLGDFQPDKTTAEIFDHQFWTEFDSQFELTELSMREDLPNLIANPTNRMKVEALMEESHQQLQA